MTKTISSKLREFQDKLQRYLGQSRTTVEVWDSTREDEEHPMFTASVVHHDTHQRRHQLQFRGYQGWLDDVRPRASVIESVGVKLAQSKKAFDKGEADVPFQ